MKKVELENNLNAIGLVYDDSGSIRQKETGETVATINTTNPLQINTDTEGFAALVEDKQKILALMIFEFVSE